MLTFRPMAATFLCIQVLFLKDQATEVNDTVVLLARNTSFEFHASPPGQGRWPVVALQTEYHPVSGAKVKILIVCFYQLLDAGDIFAWWTYAEY